MTFETFSFIYNVLFFINQTIPSADIFLFLLILTLYCFSCVISQIEIWMFSPFRNCLSILSLYSFSTFSVSSANLFEAIIMKVVGHLNRNNRNDKRHEFHSSRSTADVFMIESMKCCASFCMAMNVKGWSPHLIVLGF